MMDRYGKTYGSGSNLGHRKEGNIDSIYFW